MTIVHWWQQASNKLPLITRQYVDDVWWYDKEYFDYNNILQRPFVTRDYMSGVYIQEEEGGGGGGQSFMFGFMVSSKRHQPWIKINASSSTLRSQKLEGYKIHYDTRIKCL